MPELHPQMLEGDYQAALARSFTHLLIAIAEDGKTARNFEINQPLAILLNCLSVPRQRTEVLKIAAEIGVDGSDAEKLLLQLERDDLVMTS